MDLKLLSIFPFIANSVRMFDDQNRFLKKIILTGKICALEKASNLFTFTERTIETFRELKEELIPLLINENIKKYTEEVHSKAQISIDILIRNLFERTADVGFLATDTEIISFLKGNVTAESLRERLIEYTLKYSVYDDIIVTDVNGTVKLSMSQSLDGILSKDPIIKEALKTNSYIEQYGQSDLAPSLPKALLFAQKIIDGSATVGVLVLRFRFEDEMKRIFDSLLSVGENIVLTDGRNVIAASGKEPIPLKNMSAKLDAEYILENGFLFTPTVTKGYEGYFGAPWKSIAYINISKVTKNAPVLGKTEHKCSLDENIKSIIAKADDVIEDLSDVIINGELIASKERVYVLTPVLDNLRSVSTSILDTIKETVENLENTIMDGLVYEARASAKLAIEIMDRNLYERANDCRWWALTPVFEEELSRPEPDREKMSNVLRYINGLYTVYTNLFIYDTQGNILASSNDPSIIGRKIGGDFTSKTLSNNNAQNYFVSAFDKSPFYDNEATYIYNATIRSKGRCTGGIGIVFDSTPQFKAILNDSFPSGKKGFSCVIDRKGTVIASTHPNVSPTGKLEIGDDILRFNDAESKHVFIEYGGQKYLAGIALSKGYREYKCNDNYKNELLSLTFIEY